MIELCSSWARRSMRGYAVPASGSEAKGHAGADVLPVVGNPQRVGGLCRRRASAVGFATAGPRATSRTGDAPAIPWKTGDGRQRVSARLLLIKAAWSFRRGGGAMFNENERIP